MGQNFQTNVSDEQKIKILLQMTELALSESANLISSLGNSKVRFTVDSIGVNNKDDLDSLFNSNQPDMLAVCHRVDGGYPGNIVFLLEDLAGQVFTRQVLNERSQLKEISEMEEEALTEMGNIIVNNFLSHTAQIFHQSVSTLIPALMHGHYAQLVDELSSKPDEKEFFIVKFNIDTVKHNFFAYILWLNSECQQGSQTESPQIPDLNG